MAEHFWQLYSQPMGSWMVEVKYTMLRGRRVSGQNALLRPLIAATRARLPLTRSPHGHLGCHCYSLAASSHDIRANAANAPSNSALMKPGRSAGRIPENVLVRDRATATAGLANDVDAVNQ